VAPPWKDDFDFYEGRMADDRMIVLIDLAADRHAPLASHPVRLQVRVAMHQPRLDGLRSREEKDALFALEDRLIPALERAADGIFVGRLVAQGYTEFVFYVPAERQEEANDPVAATGDVSPYELEWFTEEDPGWTWYRELYPNQYAIQTIWNRRLVAQMKKGGDRIELPRMIDHLARFPSRERVRAAAEALAGLGFLVEEPRQANQTWELEFHRRDLCDGGRPDEFTVEILDVVLPLEGDYDGWGSVVVAGQA
jgi:hypothetical protein